MGTSFLGPLTAVAQIILSEVDYRQIPAGEPLSAGDWVTPLGQYVYRSIGNNISGVDSIGMVPQAYASGIFANVIIHGRISGLGFLSNYGIGSGAVVYLSMSSYGAFTTIPPVGSGMFMQTLGQILISGVAIEVYPKPSMQFVDA